MGKQIALAVIYFCPFVALKGLHIKQTKNNWKHLEIYCEHSPSHCLSLQRDGEINQCLNVCTITETLYTLYYHNNLCS